jgi:hypothetical protein
LGEFAWLGNAKEENGVMQEKLYEAIPTEKGSPTVCIHGFVPQFVSP